MNDNDTMLSSNLDILGKDFPRNHFYLMRVQMKDEKEIT